MRRRGEGRIVSLPEISRFGGAATAGAGAYCAPNEWAPMRYRDAVEKGSER
jgi:hypothetical protein